MPKKSSSIDCLPIDILEKLQALLQDPRCSQLEATARINEILTQKNQKIISKSAVNRYSKSIEKVGEKLKQSRAIAKIWIGELGNEPQGEVGRLLNEIVRNLAFNLAMTMSEQSDDDPISTKQISELASAVAKLESATSANEKRDQEIKNKEKERITKKLENKAKGLAKLTVEQIREALS